LGGVRGPRLHHRERGSTVVAQGQAGGEGQGRRLRLFEFGGPVRLVGRCGGFTGFHGRHVSGRGLGQPVARLPSPRGAQPGGGEAGPFEGGHVAEEDVAGGRSNPDAGFPHFHDGAGRQPGRGVEGPQAGGNQQLARVKQLGQAYRVGVGPEVQGAARATHRFGGLEPRENAPVGRPHRRREVGAHVAQRPQGQVRAGAQCVHQVGKTGLGGLVALGVQGQGRFVGGNVHRLLQQQAARLAARTGQVPGDAAFFFALQNGPAGGRQPVTPGHGTVVVPDDAPLEMFQRGGTMAGWLPMLNR
jgi:hypothetical protein